MPAVVVFSALAAADIAGCFTFWAVLRNGASAMRLAPRRASFAPFAGLLTHADVAFAGRAHAVYDGNQIAPSLT